MGRTETGNGDPNTLDQLIGRMKLCKKEGEVMEISVMIYQLGFDHGRHAGFREGFKKGTARVVRNWEVLP